MLSVLLLRLPSLLGAHQKEMQHLIKFVEDGVPSHGIRALSLTHWTVRGDALGDILDHWSTLCHLWDECLNTLLDRNTCYWCEGQDIRLQFTVWFSPQQDHSHAHRQLEPDNAEAINVSSQRPRNCEADSHHA